MIRKEREYVNDGKPILEVKNLHTVFTTHKGKVNAVRGISFDVYKVQTVGIVGESGSGKSVTALSIMNLIPNPPGYIKSGQIILQSPRQGEVDITRLSKKELRTIRGEDISMIFQEPMSSLNPVFTCGDQVMEAILQHRRVSNKAAKRKTIELFHQVQLPNPEGIFKSYPHEISGGQKQRVMIAMAMSCNPSILIADEPTTALDVTVQANILNLMRKLRDENNMSILFISHDLAVIAEIADYVLVMYEGKIVEQGAVWDIFAHPQHPYTKGLLACRPRLNHKLKVLPTIADFMDVDQEGVMSEKSSQKYRSVGEAILKNVVSQAEINERQLNLLRKPPLLEVHHLKKYFPVKRGLFGKPKEFVKAIDGVTFQVYPGETLGLVGESGCGKTTLGRTIMMLETPTEGDIIYKGMKVNELPAYKLRALRKEIQIIFQDPYASLNPRMTIGEAIIEPMRTHKVLDNEKQRKEKALELLETVNLRAGFFNRYPHEFSGGQRQRICIARSLALNPEFIICDESVSALDVSVQAQVLNLLNRLKEEFNFTYIFISHDLSVVKFLADRILVMNEGKIVESGYPESIFEMPKNNYTRNLIKAIPKGDLEDIRKSQLQRVIKNPELQKA
ncbi:MAG: ABC transporter ATP-binding protein [Cyclobacteriaceae bacterium]